MCALHDSVIKDFQSNLCNFVNSVENVALTTKNLSQIMNHVDPASMSKTYLPLLDWSQNLFILAERFEADFKSQLAQLMDKDMSSRNPNLIMGNVYEKYLFLLNHLAHSFIDIEEPSPLSASSNFDCQSSASGPIPYTNSQITLQRFRLQQQSYLSNYRRWSEANAMDTNNTNNDCNFDNNRRWSMPTSTNVNKNHRMNVPKLAGLVGNTQHNLSQSSTNDSSDEWAAIQLLSLRPPQSRPASQHKSRNSQQSQQAQQQRSQRQSRGELNEILLLQRPSDPIYLGRCQQIAENIRGESDEY